MVNQHNGVNGFEMALEEASVKHFCKLFDTLIADPTEDAFKEFETELDKLVDVSNRIDELIRTKYGRLMS